MLFYAWSLIKAKLLFCAAVLELVKLKLKLTLDISIIQFSKWKKRTWFYSFGLGLNGILRLIMDWSRIVSQSNRGISIRINLQPKSNYNDKSDGAVMNSDSSYLNGWS